MPTLMRNLIAGALAAMLVASGATAQLLPGVQLPLPPLPGPSRVPVIGPVVDDLLSQPQARRVIRPTLDSVAGLPEGLAESGSDTLMELRRMRLRELIREHPRQLESNGDGLPVRRSVVLVADPDPQSLRLAIRAGFRILSDERLEPLGFRTVAMATPRGMSSREGLERLRKVAPALDADFDHVYEPAGSSLAPVAGALAASQSGGGLLIGMIDGAVASHPSLAGASIEQKGFAGNAQPTGHGTAVASLIAGNQGPFHGAARGASLLVADVYGGSRAAGSASVIVKALAWLASRQPKVINISLVGPQNRLVRRALDAVRKRGIYVVAAVGNDGPAAPPAYPASYGGVVSVTGVDDRGRALPEAGRPKHLDFAAPGADMAAALPGEGYTEVRGTSFAAPLAAARLAIAGSIRSLAAEARDGRGKVGRGIVCGSCAVEPDDVDAK